MRLKKCLKCGELFSATRQEQSLCDKCIAEGKSTTMRPRACRECGVTFDGGPRAWYCPSCRAIRSKDAHKRFHASGPARPLGSIDYCTVCGKEYIVNGARQRYCPDCAPEAVRAVDREASKRWNKENLDANRATKRGGEKVCVICGKPVPFRTARITCSDECDKLRKKLLQEEADLRRGKRKSPPSVQRLDKDAAIDTAPPEVINSLMDDIRSVIVRCQDCGDWFVKKSAAAKICKECSRKHKLEYMREYANAKYHEQIKNPQEVEARKRYQAEYYLKNKERLQEQRKSKKQK